MIELGRHLRTVYTVKTEKGIFIQDKKVCLVDDMLNRHILIQGIPNSGKTTLLRHLIQQVLDKKRKLVVIDGAGNPQFAQDVCALAHQAGLPPTPVIRYPSEDGESAKFNGFLGGHQGIYNRLVALLALEEAGTDGDYHRAKKRDALSHVVGLNTHLDYPEIEPIAAPRSFEEVLTRLDKSWWRQAYGKSERAMVSYDTLEEYVKQLHTDIASTIRPFRHLLSEDGLVLGQEPLIMVSIGRAEGGYSAQALFRYFGEAVVGAMKTMGDTAWIIDEIGVFGAEVVSTYTKIGRQYGLGLVMAYQDVASLGVGKEEQFTREVLGTTGTHVLMRSNASEEMRSRAGYTVAEDRRHTYYDKGESKTVGSRQVEKISHDDANTLPTGQFFAVVGGHVVKVAGELVQIPRFEPFMEQVYAKSRRENLTLPKEGVGRIPERSPM